MENIAFKLDGPNVPLSTSTTHVGGTGTLVTLASEDCDQLVFEMVVVSLTGSPQLTVSNGATSGGSFTVEKTFTLDATYAGKTVLVQVIKPIANFYRLSLNLNGGTINIAIKPVSGLRYGFRRAPIGGNAVAVSGINTIVLTQVAGNS